VFQGLGFGTPWRSASAVKPILPQGESRCAVGSAAHIFVLLCTDDSHYLQGTCYSCCRSCQTADGSEDLKKGTQLLEVYAVEIQMYTEQRNNKKLKQLYQKALGVKSAIPHPRVQGIIRECGGKMHMHDQNWPEAATDFFEVSGGGGGVAACRWWWMRAGRWDLCTRISQPPSVHHPQSTTMRVKARV
jgi:hypothetical protein